MTALEGLPMAAPRCEHPTIINRNGHRLHVPCGHCYTCRRRLVRSRQGQALAEQLHPVYREHMLPTMQHWLTLTYSDDTVPWTTPVPHPLGRVVDEDGNDIGPYRGPFVGGKRTATLSDDQHREAVYGSSWGDREGDFVTPADLREMHREQLEAWGWSSKDITQWVEGTYKPARTVRSKDAQDFVKRLRRRAEYHSNGELTIRIIWATEYGGVTDRPHIHVAIFGLPQDLIEHAYEAWPYGLVHPPLVEARVSGASLMRDKAATYQAKDIVKGAAHFRRSPADLAREAPRVQGSKNPPIGAGAYPMWLEYQVKPKIDAAQALVDAGEIPEKYDGDGEVFVTCVAREASNQLTLRRSKFHAETFPVMDHWKGRLRKDLGISDAQWDRAGALMDEWRAATAQILETPEAQGGLAEAYHDHQRELRERGRRNQEAEKRRVEQKRSKLIAAGALQPGD